VTHEVPSSLDHEILRRSGTCDQNGCSGLDYDPVSGAEGRKGEPRVVKDGIGRKMIYDAPAHREDLATHVSKAIALFQL